MTTARQRSRMALRSGTIAAAVVIGGSLGIGSAAASGGEEAPMPAAPVPAQTAVSPCRGAQVAAQQLAEATAAKAAAEAKAAADSKAAVNAAGIVHKAADTGAPSDVTHDAALQAAITQQVSDSSQSALAAATETVKGAETLVKQVGDCQQVTGYAPPSGPNGVPLVPPLVPPIVPPIPADLPVTPASGDTAPPAVVPASNQAPQNIPATSPGKVQTPAAQVQTGRDSSSFIGQATHWIMNGLGLALIALGAVILIGRRRNRDGAAAGR